MEQRAGQITGVAGIIQERLEKSLNPRVLEIRDDSHKHRGHAGHDGQGESHFFVEIVSDAFEGKSRVERQRMVYECLGDLLQKKIHALALKTDTPGETDPKSGG